MGCKFHPDTGVDVALKRMFKLAPPPTTKDFSDWRPKKKRFGDSGRRLAVHRRKVRR
jgi:hypothetical protein